MGECQFDGTRCRKVGASDSRNLCRSSSLLAAPKSWSGQAGLLDLQFGQLLAYTDSHLNCDFPTIPSCIYSTHDLRDGVITLSPPLETAEAVARVEKRGRFLNPT